MALSCTWELLPSPAPTLSFSMLAVDSSMPLVYLGLALPFCFPEVGVAADNITIINRHDLIAADSDYCLLHNRPAKVKDHCSVGVGRSQRDCEGQAGCSRNNHILSAKVGKADKELLVLVNGRGVVTTTLCRMPLIPSGS